MLVMATKAPLLMATLAFCSLSREWMRSEIRVALAGSVSERVTSTVVLAGPSTSSGSTGQVGHCPADT